MKSIYLVVGKSGSGKSTIVHELCRRYQYKEVQSYTERPKRYEDEIGHIFISKEEFDKLEDLCAYTVFNGNRYGVPSSMIDESDLYVIDTAGIKYMQEHYHGIKNIVVIGICCSDDNEADMSIRAHRMLTRGDAEEAVTSRIENDETAFADFDELIDYKIINQDLESSIEKIQSIILKTR